MPLTASTLLPILMLAVAGVLAMPALLAFGRSWKAKEDLERRLERAHAARLQHFDRDIRSVGQRAAINRAECALVDLVCVAKLFCGGAELFCVEAML